MAPGRVVTFEIPGPLPSRSNERLHWSKRGKLSRSQRRTAYFSTRSAFAGRPLLTLPIVVTLARVSPRPLDEDNLQGAFKSLRDGIADVFQVDDSPQAPITWKYCQRRGTPARAEIAMAEK